MRWWYRAGELGITVTSVAGYDIDIDTNADSLSINSQRSANQMVAILKSLPSARGSNSVATVCLADRFA